MFRKILIASEDEENRAEWAGSLSEEYDILAAVNARSALSVLEEKYQLISAVVLDIDMITMDGFEVFTQIRTDSRFLSIPIIIITARLDREIKEVMLESGANGIITKPVKINLLTSCLNNNISIKENAALINSLSKDKLTGLMSRDLFFDECDKRIADRESGYYVMSCLDIDNFKVLNDQYGMNIGDRILRYVASCIEECVKTFNGLSCRFTADRFAIMYPVSYMDSEIIINSHKKTVSPDCINRTIRIRIGRYIVNDCSIRANIMFERATVAEEAIKGRYDIYIAQYNDAMRTSLLREQQIVSDMTEALDSGEFVPFFQPQYNHATKAIIGAEALARWKRNDKYISPSEFIPIFERNGFIYELDKCIWESVCKYLKKWREEKKNLVPVSVNISRFDLLREDFYDVICGLVMQYEIPVELLRLEVTESAFADSPKQIFTMVNRLIEYGFTVEIDDFGSGYSSLNTLKDVAASILKLDMKFFENSENSQRSGNIVESVVRMAKWLGMAVIAEGVEEEEQADYLKSIGCYYIQGYYYDKPMPVDEYEKRMEGLTEPKLTRVVSVASLNNNQFWNPKSMETLIFNSYVGGACIFEYYNGETELLRTNEQFIKEHGRLMKSGDPFAQKSPVHFLNDENKKILNDSIAEAIKTKRETAFELRLYDNHVAPIVQEYIRYTLRVISSTDERYLFYCVLVNMTKQHNDEQLRLEAEKKEMESAEQLQVIMDNISGGVSAIQIDDKGKSHFIFSNERYFELYGYTKEEIEKENIDVMSLIVPEDFNHVMKCIRKQKKDRKPYVIDYRCRKKNGEIVYLRVNASLVKMAGYGENVLVSVVTDITELREAEQKEKITSGKLKTVLNHAGNGITAVIMHKDKNEFLFANDEYFQLLGYTREEYERKFKDNLYYVIYPDDREFVRTTVRKANSLSDGGTVEFRVLRPNGKIVWLKASIVVTRLPGIDDVVQIAVFTNITEEKEANEQLLFLNETAHDILAQQESEKAIHDTLKRLLTYFAGDRAYIIEIDHKKNVCNNTYEVCAPGVTSEIEKLQQVPVSVSPEWFEKLSKNEFIQIDEVDDLPDTEADLRELLQEQNIHSLIITPLVRKKILIGYVGVDNPTKSENQLTRLAAVGDYIAVLLTHRDLSNTIREEDSAISLLMKDTPGGFCRIRINANQPPLLVYANDGFCQLLNMSHDEVMETYGDKIYLCIHPDDIGPSYKLAEERIQHERQFTTRCRLKRKDETYVQVMVFGRYTRNSNDEIYLNSYYADMSKQLKVEEKQKELLDNMPCGAALYEFDGLEIKAIHINKRYWELVNRKPVENSELTVMDGIHPDDNLLAQQEIGAAIRQNRNAVCDLRIRYGKSEYRSFHVVASITRKENGNYILYTSYTAISNRELSIQQILPIALATVMKASEDLSYIKDAQLRYICCSRSVASILGLPNPEAIVGKSDYDLFDLKSADMYSEDDRRILSSGESLTNYVERIPRKDGNICIADTSKFPIMDSEGKVIGIYGISRDVTEAKEKESQLKLLTGSIPGGVAAFSIQKGRIETLFFNDGFYRFSGYNREEYIEMTREDPLALVYEKDREGILRIVRTVENNQILNEIEGCVFRYRTKSGEVRWMSLKCRISRIEDNRFVMNVVQMDITEQKEIEKNLRMAEEKYRIAARHGGRTIARYDIKSSILTIESGLASQLSFPIEIKDVPYGRVKLGKISQETKDIYIQFYENIRKGVKEGEAMFQKNLPNGWRWLNAHFTTIMDDEGTPVSALISYIDVTEQYEKEAIYRKWQQSLADRPDNSYSLFRCDLSADASFDSSEGTLISFHYDDGRALSFNECTNRYAKEYVAEEDREEYINSLQTDRLLADYYRGKRKMSMEYRELMSGGDVRWIRRSIDLVERPDSSGIMAYLMYENIDISKKAELNTQTLAETDALTGLLNRKAFAERMTQMLQSRQENTFFAFFMLDVDRFKEVNDTLGHATGDKVLIDIGKTIKSAVLECDLVGRLGGDEFIVCMCNVPNIDIIQKKARRIWKLTHKELTSTLIVSTSIGIAIGTGENDDFDSLYHKADKALYRVKENGKDNYGFYNDD